MMTIDSTQSAWRSQTRLELHLLTRSLVFFVFFFPGSHLFDCSIAMCLASALASSFTAASSAFLDLTSATASSASLA
jgi:hypothetical protein